MKISGASDEQPPDRGEQAIRDVVERAAAAQNDIEGLAALHSPGAVVVNLAGRRVFGRNAFIEAMTTALKSPLQDVLTEVTVDDVRFATTDTAVVSCTKTVHDRRASAARTALPPSGALTYVLVNEDGRWKITLAQTTPMLM